MAEYLYQELTVSGISEEDINNQVTGTINSFSAKSKNIAVLDCDPSDEPDATEFLATKGLIKLTEDPLSRVTTLFETNIPLNGVTSSEFPYMGEYASVLTGQTADISSTFSMACHSMIIRVNSITTGGDIVITGTTQNPLTNVPQTSVSETITVDTTLSEYRSSNVWLEVASVNVSTGTITGIDFDVLTIDTYNGFGSDFRFLGYKIDNRSSASDPDIALQIRKFSSDPVTKKVTIITLEDIGWDSTVSGGERIDNLRTAGSDRSYTYSSEHWPANRQLPFQQFDFDIYFSSGENRILGSQGDGILVDFKGAPSGNISNVENVVLTLVLQS